MNGVRSGEGGRRGRRRRGGAAHGARRAANGRGGGGHGAAAGPPRRRHDRRRRQAAATAAPVPRRRRAAARVRRRSLRRRSRSSWCTRPPSYTTTCSTGRRCGGAAHRRRDRGAAVATATGDLLFSRAFAELAGRVRGRPSRVSRTRPPSWPRRAHATRGRLAGGCRPSRYLERCRLKTAVLFRASCELGGLEGDDESTWRAWPTFGEQIGLAFQILDDVLDVTGPPERTGKPQGADLLDGTVTLPLITRAGVTRTGGARLRDLRTPGMPPGVRADRRTSALETRGRAPWTWWRVPSPSLPDLPERQRMALELVAGGVVERYCEGLDFRRCAAPPRRWPVGSLKSSGPRI